MSSPIYICVCVYIFLSVLYPLGTVPLLQFWLDAYRTEAEQPVWAELLGSLKVT